MTKKSKANEPATKKDLDKLATKIDLKKLRSEFVGFRSETRSTKKSLFGQMLKLEEKVEQVEEKLEKTEDRLSEQMRNQHDEVMTTLSNFGGRVTTLEDENTIGAEHTRQLRVEAGDHEKRITRLESATTT